MLSSRSGIWEVVVVEVHYNWLLTTFSQSHIVHYTKVPRSCAIVNKQPLKRMEDKFILKLNIPTGAFNKERYCFQGAGRS